MFNNDIFSHNKLDECSSHMSKVTCNISLNSLFSILKKFRSRFVRLKFHLTKLQKINLTVQPAFTRSKSTIETPEQFAKYV